MGRPTAQAQATPRPDPSLLLSAVHANRHPKAYRGPRQQAPQGHNTGFLGFLWASKPAVCQPLNP